MSRLPRREWYRRVNAAWPAGALPELTAQEAVSAARRLYRFVRGRKCPYPVRLTSGNRYTQIYGGVVYVNPQHGWKEFVHLLSHALYRGPHSAEHARGELRLIKQVIRRGWLDGTLKRVPKPVKPRDLLVERYQRVVRLQQTWTRKAKLATTKLKKLAQRRRYYERQIMARGTGAWKEAP